MVSTICRSSPVGTGLSVTTTRSGMLSPTKLLLLASATMMSSLLPTTAFGQTQAVAKPPVSPEVLAVHRLAKRPVAKSAATTDAAVSVAGSSFGSNRNKGSEP